MGDQLKRLSLTDMIPIRAMAWRDDGITTACPSMLRTQHEQTQSQKQTDNMHNKNLNTHAPPVYKYRRHGDAMQRFELL